MWIFRPKRYSERWIISAGWLGKSRKQIHIAVADCEALRHIDRREPPSWVGKYFGAIDGQRRLDCTAIFNALIAHVENSGIGQLVEVVRETNGFIEAAEFSIESLEAMIVRHMRRGFIPSYEGYSVTEVGNDVIIDFDVDRQY